MNTPETSDYMLLFRGNLWDKELSPEQIQKVVGDWAAWFEGLMNKRKALAGHPLLDEGKVVSGKSRSVADGPFAESKEAIAGYFYLRVSGMDEAVEIARQCPGLEFGVQVEVRPVAPTCTVSRRAQEQGISIDHVLMGRFAEPAHA